MYCTEKQHNRRKMVKARSVSATVCLLSPHPLVLQQFQRLLGAPDLEVRAYKVEMPFRTEADELSVPPATLYVVDAETAGRSAEALVATLAKSRPGAKMLVIGDEFSEARAFPLLRLGVKGLLRYAEVEQQLARAVQSVSFGGYWVPRTVLSKFVDTILQEQSRRPAPSAFVSSRERQVLDALLQNLSNKEIADKLNISERTVKFHVSNLLSKFGVQRRADLILLSFQNNALPSAGAQLM